MTSQSCPQMPDTPSDFIFCPMLLCIALDRIMLGRNVADEICSKTIQQMWDLSVECHYSLTTTRSRPTCHHMDPSDPPVHGNIGDWCSRAGWGQIVWRQIATAGCYGWSLRAMMMMMMMSLLWVSRFSFLSVQWWNSWNIIFGDRCSVGADPFCGTAFQLVLAKPTLAMNSFKWLLKSYLFGCWHRSTLWLTV